MDSTHPDVIVVGAGVVGLSCALELLQRGRRVEVIDAGRPGAGASHGNCGTITPSHAPPLAAPGMVSKALRWMLQPAAPLYIRPRWNPSLWAWLARFATRCNGSDWRRTALAKGALLGASRQALEEWVKRYRLDCEFRPSGLAYVFRQHSSLDHHLAELPLLAELGVAAEVWDGARLAREEPALQDGMAGGVFFPGDACIRPDRLIASLLQRVKENGGQVLAGQGVESLELDTQPAVRLGDGQRRQAGQLVLATGAWSPRWSRALGLRIPIQPGKGYSITYDRPELAPLHPLVLKERSVCVTAWGSGFRLGSTMEFSGYDTQLNPVRLQALVRGAREYLRVPEGPVKQEEWYGWRPMTWDDLPLIGPVPGRPGVVLAAGHGMMGVSMSTITALMVAAAVCGDTPPLDPTPYRPERFG